MVFLDVSASCALQVKFKTYSEFREGFRQFIGFIGEPDEKTGVQKNLGFTTHILARL